MTGAYKIRAAHNVLRSLPAERRRRGVVVASSGNFAQAFAFAGARSGVPIVVAMLDTTSPFKVEATRGLGAEVVFCGTDALARQAAVERVAAERAMVAVDFFEERPIIAGHASLGLEILEDDPGVEQILVPVSSGGLAAGIATAVKLTRPGVKVIGVQPERANAYYRSHAAGRPVAIDDWESIADGLSARRPGEFPFRHLEAYLDDVVLVPEVAIARAFRTILFRAKLLAEPAGAVAAAAFLAAAAPGVDPARRTVALLSGGNVAAPMVSRMLEMAGGE